MGYIAHCDPQGTLPPWLVNKVTHSLGPRMVKDLRKAALGYKKWKNGQTHHRKPWRFPEEIITPRISVLDVSHAIFVDPTDPTDLRSHSHSFCLFFWFPVPVPGLNFEQKEQCHRTEWLNIAETRKGAQEIQELSKIPDATETADREIAKVNSGLNLALVLSVDCA